MIFLLVFLILSITILIFYFKFNSFRRFPNVLLISGGVKSGKSFVSITIVKRLLFKQRFKVFLFNTLFYLPKFFLNKCFKTHYILWHRLPVLYSNIPLYKIKYYPLTTSVLRRDVTIIPKSIILIDECFFTADSMSFKDPKLNDDLSEFVKLFGHMSHGGYLIMNTQSLSDLHYAFKRSIGDFYYIYRRIKFPFFSFVKIKQIYCLDGSTVNDSTFSFNDYSMLIFNRNYKLYDCYCYSCLTDSKPLTAATSSYIRKRKNLKIDRFVSFKKWKGVEQFDEENLPK